LLRMCLATNTQSPEVNYQVKIKLFNTGFCLKKPVWATAYSLGRETQDRE